MWINIGRWTNNVHHFKSLSLTKRILAHLLLTFALITCTPYKEPIDLGFFSADNDVSVDRLQTAGFHPIDGSSIALLGYKRGDTSILYSFRKLSTGEYGVTHRVCSITGIDADSAAAILKKSNVVFPGWSLAKDTVQVWRYSFVQSRINGTIFYCNHSNKILTVYHDFPNCPQQELTFNHIDIESLNIEDTSKTHSSNEGSN